MNRFIDENILQWCPIQCLEIILKVYHLLCIRFLHTMIDKTKYSSYSKTLLLLCWILLPYNLFNINNTTRINIGTIAQFFNNFPCKWLISLVVYPIWKKEDHLRICGCLVILRQGDSIETSNTTPRVLPVIVVSFRGTVLPGTSLKVLYYSEFTFKPFSFNSSIFSHFKLLQTSS